MSEKIISHCPNCGGEISLESPHGLCPKCLLALASLPTEPRPAKSEPPVVSELAAAFPQLEILGLIGQGGMGFVFKARQQKLDRLVALKILPQSLAGEATFAARFAREGRLLARLNHPNIVAVHDFGQAGGFFYLLMEFVDGVSLRQALRAGRFTPAQAIGIVPGICEALQYAHNEGILHRDIKPENILLDSKGRVKIADFGIAKLAGEAHEGTLTASGATLGTPHYMAPEQIDHPENVDQRADIYSLGVVFYEMLTGELPIGRFAAPSKKSAVDPRMDDVVMRSLENERQQRQSSANEVKTQVEEITRQPETRLDEQGNGSRGRIFGTVVAGAISIVLLVYLGGIWLRYRAKSLIVAPETNKAVTATRAISEPTPQESHQLKSHLAGSNTDRLLTVADIKKAKTELLENRLISEQNIPQDLRNALADLAVITNTYGPDSSEVTTRKARIAELEYLTREEPNIPQDLRDAEADLAAATNTFGPASLEVRTKKARVAELEYLTREEPSTPQDLRDARVALATLREQFGPPSAQIKAAGSRIAELEYLTGTKPNIPQDLRDAEADLAAATNTLGPDNPDLRSMEARVAELDARQKWLDAQFELIELQKQLTTNNPVYKAAEKNEAILERRYKSQLATNMTGQP